VVLTDAQWCSSILQLQSDDRLLFIGQFPMRE
jgi:hypothetical protein